MPGFASAPVQDLKRPPLCVRLFVLVYIQVRLSLLFVITVCLCTKDQVEISMVLLLDECWNKTMMKAVILCAFGQDMGSMQCSSLKRAAHEMAILLWAQGGTASVALVRFRNRPQGRGD